MRTQNFLHSLGAEENTLSIGTHAWVVWIEGRVAPRFSAMSLKSIYLN